MSSAKYISIFCLLLSASSLQAAEQRKNLGNVTGGDFKQAQNIIDRKCTLCHSKERIDIALKSGKDMNAIQKAMEKRGAHISTNEREVLGIFWNKSKPISK